MSAPITNGTSNGVNGHHHVNGNSESNGTFLFTSESVGDGHPDKLCDQVSDSVLDAYLKQDPNAKVACETCTKTGMIMVFGEVKSTAHIDYQKVVRDAVRRIGYDDSSKGFDANTCNVLVALEEQSADIAQAVHLGRDLENLTAGDQGIMFGYASDETPECMPVTILWAHQLNYKLRELRNSGVIGWARPDSKTQVTVEYREEGGACVPIRVHTVVISVQHSPDVTNEQIAKDLREKVIKAVIPSRYLDDNTVYHLNPSGRFVIGGPMGDAGLTGRKIIVDTYGGWGAHGGGAFSGKDSSKVDRSAAYAARWIAKSLVAAGLCRRTLVQISYAIGVREPLSVYLHSYGTVGHGSAGTKLASTDADLLRIVQKNFDLRPGVVIRDLGLQQPIFARTACYGHFGRPEFAWEQPKKLVF